LKTPLIPATNSHQLIACCIDHWKEKKEKGKAKRVGISAIVVTKKKLKHKSVLEIDRIK
jgi:hypothetical protein